MRIGIPIFAGARDERSVARYLSSLLHALSGRTDEHAFTLFIPEADLPCFSFVETRMNLVAVAERWRAAGWNSWWHQAILPTLARQHRLDCLHIPNCRKVPRSKRCALVATINHLEPSGAKGRGSKGRLFKRVVRTLAWRQDAVIVFSNHAAREVMARSGLSGDRVFVVPNGIDHARFYPGARDEARERVRARYGIETPFFLCIAPPEDGGLNHLKLLSAYEELKAATHLAWGLVLAGSDGKAAEILQQAINRSPFVSQIHSIGCVPDEDLPDLHRSADVFVYPSLYALFGMPPLEAMACGTPVIAPATGELGEALGGAAAAIDAQDPHTIARELYILATNGEVRNRLRAAGLSQVRNFTWDRTAAGTVAAYEKALANWRARSRNAA